MNPVCWLVMVVVPGLGLGNLVGAQPPGMPQNFRPHPGEYNKTHFGGIH